MSKNVYNAIFIFIGGFLTEFILSIIAKHTQKLLINKPDQCPYCEFYFDEEED